MTKTPSDQFSPIEARRRFEAALRGARVAGHKPMTEMQGRKAKASRTLSPRQKRRKSQPKKATTF